MTGHYADICLRLRRQGPLPSQPVPDALGTRIIGGRSQPEITELLPHLAQERARFRQRLDRIERVVQEALLRGHRHKLGDALGPLAAARYRPYCIGLKAALLPNDSREKFEWQVVCSRGGCDQLASAADDDTGNGSASCVSERCASAALASNEAIKRAAIVGDAAGLKPKRLVE
jgi:hypothetical protein